MPIKTYQTYLTFDGDCRAAFDFYRSVFGGEFHEISTFAEAPDDMAVAAADKDKVMHVSLAVGESVLMGSDGMGPVKAGNNFALSVETDTPQEADALLATLSSGGEVTMPMDKTFWGAYFGTCTDRFGIGWMVVCELDAAG